MDCDRVRIGEIAVVVVAAVIAPVTQPCVPITNVAAAFDAGVSASGSFGGLVASITSSSS